MPQQEEKNNTFSRTNLGWIPLDVWKRWPANTSHVHVLLGGKACACAAFTIPELTLLSAYSSCSLHPTCMSTKFSSRQPHAPSYANMANSTNLTAFYPFGAWFFHLSLTLLPNWNLLPVVKTSNSWMLTHQWSGAVVLGGGADAGTALWSHGFNLPAADSSSFSSLIWFSFLILKINK